MSRVNLGRVIEIGLGSGDEEVAEEVDVEAVVGVWLSLLSSGCRIMQLRKYTRVLV